MEETHIVGNRKACPACRVTDHSKSLYMIVKKTCRKRLTAFITTANRYNHASPDILLAQVCISVLLVNKPQDRRLNARLRFREGSL